MRIGVASWFNPKVISDLLFDNDVENIPDINKGISSVNTLVREMVLQGCNVVVFTYGAIKKKHIVLEGEKVKVHILNSEYGIRGLSNFDRLYMQPRLTKVIESEIANIDVLHAHWTYDFALVAKKFERILPVFCSVRDWCPYIMSMNVALKDRIIWQLYYYIFKRVMNSDRIHFIANSDYTKKQILGSYPLKHVDIIPNPIYKGYVLEKKVDRPAKPVFIAISQSAGGKRKNYDVLIKAFHLYRNHRPDAELRLVGNGFGEGSALVERWRIEKLLDGVRLYGFVSHEELMEVIDTSTALIHPSLEETFGNILLEGMARCTIVIGGDKSGAVPQVLGYGKYGILCDVTDPKSICDAMIKTENEELVLKYTRNATSYLKNNYCSDSVVQAHLNLYEKYLKE